jgi:hypothetical protein
VARCAQVLASSKDELAASRPEAAERHAPHAPPVPPHAPAPRSAQPQRAPPHKPPVVIDLTSFSDRRGRSPWIACRPPAGAHRNTFHATRAQDASCSGQDRQPHGQQRRRHSRRVHGQQQLEAMSGTRA